MRSKTYRKTDNIYQSCVTCGHSMRSKPFCKKWLEWITPNMVCDDFKFDADKLKKEYIDVRRQTTSRSEETD